MLLFGCDKSLILTFAILIKWFILFHTVLVLMYWLIFLNDIWLNLLLLIIMIQIAAEFLPLWLQVSK